METLTVEKLNENEIKVTKTSEVVAQTNTYSYEFLVKQRQAILDQKERDNLQRDKELAEVDKLLGECDKLGVTVKGEEETVPMEVEK